MDVETVRLILERTFQMPVAESDAQIVLDRLGEIFQQESRPTQRASDVCHVCGAKLPALTQICVVWGTRA